MKENTKFKSWIILAEHSKETDKLNLKAFTQPLKVGKHYTPANLNDITIGQMVQLSECENDRAMFYTVCNVLLGMSQKEVDNTKATEIVRFCGWVYSEVEKINNLFDSVKSKPTKEEIQAGINGLKFGVFGLIDWYALRMGITDHEEVTKVTWGRVYKCLEMDNKKHEYEKRLSEVYNENRK